MKLLTFQIKDDVLNLNEFGRQISYKAVGSGIALDVGVVVRGGGGCCYSDGLL